MWWTDLFGGTFADKQVTGLLAQLKQIDVENLKADKRSTAEVAVILDEASFTYCGDGEPVFNAWLTAQSNGNWGSWECRGNPIC